MRYIRITICFLAALIGNSALAAVRYVPDEYATIQAAIDACNDYDSVVIAPGTYTGSGNRNIKLNGKPITIRSIDPCDPQVVSSTIIDCEGLGQAFAFNKSESDDSTIAGLTITNGYALLGGAIYCYNNSSPSITHCVITNNSAVLGGAIASTNSKGHPNITNCTIIANAAVIGGGGIYCNGSSPTIQNCIIAGNYAPDGGAIHAQNEGSPLVVNCTIVANAASGSAGGVYCYNSSNLTLNNNILWGNTAETASEIRVDSLGAPTSIQISYCDIQELENSVKRNSDCTIKWGQGNIDSDPCFVEMGFIEDEIYVAGDYHLLDDSPCINAGDTDANTSPEETDIDGNPRILGGRIDIGVDEYVPPIIAYVKIIPQILNMSIKGFGVNCYIRLPKGYNVADIDTTTIVLNGQISPQWNKINEKYNELITKFNYDEIQSLLQDADETVPLTITGVLKDGTAFSGTDTIKIISFCCNKKNFKFRFQNHFFRKSLKLFRPHKKCRYMLPCRAFLHRRKVNPRCFNPSVLHK